MSKYFPIKLTALHSTRKQSVYLMRNQQLLNQNDYITPQTAQSVHGWTKYCVAEGILLFLPQFLPMPWDR